MYHPEVTQNQTCLVSLATSTVMAPTPLLRPTQLCGPNPTTGQDWPFSTLSGTTLVLLSTLLPAPQASRQPKSRSYSAVFSVPIVLRPTCFLREGSVVIHPASPTPRNLSLSPVLLTKSLPHAYPLMTPTSRSGKPTSNCTFFFF